MLPPFDEGLPVAGLRAEVKVGIAAIEGGKA